ncbi:Bax inhibitor-1/YccA family protein [Hymenobacter sp. 5516J-16]|uniref:Bax inhibitor-1/YccA family protein n=1 Tax=Hymenobacter sp. 5516J-16 TaxID=2932253 RepID=UPI001FD58811|nr:Bax inhibitor-1/YccA family protein [Hymenobacter sp. 5516J-16]UOQ76317.1 Bax inhibitor-1/YccA family protein [Hymenobacter sp. 5516J-16]
MEEFVPDEQQNTQPTLRISAEDAARIQGAFMQQVYGWMAGALALTGGVAMLVASSEVALEFIFNHIGVFLGLFLVEVLLVSFLSRKALEWSVGVTSGVFMAYAVVSGVTLSVIFLAYTMGSIASTFFITAGTFGVMSLYGYFTRTDLSRWGNILMMGLIGLILASVVNLFLHSEVLYWVATFVGVIVFVALIAYDTQKLKMLAFMGLEDEATDRKAAVLGALILYLDFINLFLLLLRIFGRRR